MGFPDIYSILNFYLKAGWGVYTEVEEVRRGALISKGRAYKIWFRISALLSVTSMMARCPYQLPHSPFYPLTVSTPVSAASEQEKHIPIRWPSRTSK